MLMDRGKMWAGAFWLCLRERRCFQPVRRDRELSGLTEDNSKFQTCLAGSMERGKVGGRIMALLFD